jgi:SNF2 family DNA or RNA helicase
MTATPTVNNPLEVFNMLQFIAPEEMDKRNVHNMGEFFGIFGEVQKTDYLRANNEIVQRDTLTGFKTLPELRQLMHEYTDMRTAEDVGLKIPKADEQNILSPKTPLQAEVYDALRNEANTYLKMTPKERIEAGYEQGDYMKILSDMQKATISLKILANTGSEFAPRSLLTPDALEKHSITPKMQQCVENTLTTVKEGDKKLIFCEYKEAQEELKEYLIKAGVPAKEIMVVNADTAGKSEQRQKISVDYNSGKYKVVIGNRTMSEGMNFQVETAAIDHLDIPYTPSALTQRNGRGVRQGNKIGRAHV